MIERMFERVVEGVVEGRFAERLVEPVVWFCLKIHGCKNWRGNDPGNVDSTPIRSEIHVLAKDGDTELVKQKLESNPSLVEKRNPKGDTPLHIASRLGYLEMAKLLILVGKRQKKNYMMNWKGETALHEAIRNGHSEVAELLIKDAPRLTHFRNKIGESPLFLAFDRGFYIIANLLLDEAAQICCYEGRHGMNALHAAIIRTPGKDYVSKILKKCPPRIMQKADEDKGWIPLHYAAYLGNVEVVQLFLEKNSSRALIKDANHKSALHISSEQGHVEVVRQFISKCPNSCFLLDKQKQTVLHLAVECGQIQMVQLLLQSDLPDDQDLINWPNSDGNTAIHIAAVAEQFEILELLIKDKRVDKGAINKARMTVFDIIRSRKPLERDDNSIQEIMSKLEQMHALPSLNQTTLFSQQTREAVQSIEINENKQIEETIHKNHATNISKIETNLSDYKDLASFNTTTATLISTVTFAAAFQVPGGYNNDGFAILSPKKVFQVFLLFDAMAFGLSVASLFVYFLYIVLSKNYSYKYPRVFLMILTELSIASMFCAFLFAVLVVLPIISWLPWVVLATTLLCLGIPLYCFIFMVESSTGRKSSNRTSDMYPTLFFPWQQFLSQIPAHRL